MEACAIGRPIITTDIPGCKETVEKGKNGYLIPKDNVQALAEAMKRFIDLPTKEKNKMAMNSHQIAVERFDVQQVINIYHHLLASAPGHFI
jgi:glycosyltransferase involved in cell wall biosynthesis